MADQLSIDFETYSDVSLPDVGASVYTRHPSAEVLMCAYALNDGEIQQWIPAEGEPIPELLDEALDDPEVEKWAWNAQFEMNVLRNTLRRKVAIPQWRCTMVQAMSCSLPGKLATVGPILGVPLDKQKDAAGKLLMKTFSFPRKPTKKNPATRTYWYERQEEWSEYLTYNRQDVAAERSIKKRLRPYPMSPDEWELWFIDQQINEAGIPINRAMVDNAIRIYEEALEDGFSAMREFTGLRNPNSGPQLLPWLKEQGYMFDDLKKGHIKTAADYFKTKPDHWSEDRWIEYRSNDALKAVLSLRRDTSRTSIKKFYALQRATDQDGMLRYTLQMNGAARTGRYAGRIYQPQNIAKPEKALEDLQVQVAQAVEVLDYEGLKLVFGNPFDALAASIRPSAQAPEGMMFVDADLSAIENRVLGWLAGCDKILDVFRKNLDPYISFATYLYAQPYEKLWHEYKVEKIGTKRTIAKPGTLGCGYGMGHGEIRENRQTGEIEATGLLGYAWNMGVKSFTLDDSKHSVETFRREFSEVKDYWYEIERCARRCIVTHKTVRCGVILFRMNGPFLEMVLPSGRPLRYLRPKLENRKTPWGDTKLQITYEGLNDRKQWVRLHTTPGKLTENADQAISRDLLTHGIKLAVKRGIDVRLHVHDQQVGLVAEREAEEKLDLLKECMEEQPKWAAGLPLGSAGLTTRYFIKD